MNVERHIIDYLLSIGYSHNEVGNILVNPTIFTNKNVKIEFDTLFRLKFIIYKDEEEVFDINKVSRRVFPVKHNSEKIKSIGIPHPISLSEVKEAIRILNINTLLDE